MRSRVCVGLLQRCRCVVREAVRAVVVGSGVYTVEFACPSRVPKRRLRVRAGAQMSLFVERLH